MEFLQVRTPYEWGISFSKVTDLQAGHRGSIPDRDRGGFFLHHVQMPAGHSSLYPMGYEEKQRQWENNSSDTQINNVWSFVVTSPYAVIHGLQHKESF
jgi:hypothetical protein